MRDDDGGEKLICVESRTPLKQWGGGVKVASR